MLLLLNINISKSINLYIIERTGTGYVTSNLMKRNLEKKLINQEKNKTGKQSKRQKKK